MVLRDNAGLFVAGLIAVPLCAIGAMLALALRHFGRGLAPRHVLLLDGWFTSAIMLAHALREMLELAMLVVRSDGGASGGA